MSHWPFVVAAYALVLGVLLAYWWSVERGIRRMERATATAEAETGPRRAGARR